MFHDHASSIMTTHDCCIDCYVLGNTEAGRPPWVIISWMCAWCLVGTHLRETFLWIQIMITVYRWVFIIQEILKIRRVVDAAPALFFCKGRENEWKLLQPCHQDELVKVEFFISSPDMTGCFYHSEPVLAPYGLKLCNVLKVTWQNYSPSLKMMAVLKLGLTESLL